MSAHHVLLIENPARLRVDTGRLCIEQNDLPPAYVLPEDIDVLCLHHPVISLSVAALQRLTESGAIVLLTDERHQPSGLLYPLQAHQRQSMRLRQQIDFEQVELHPQLWQQIVQTRILGQATTLRRLKRKGALYLERLAKKVEPGDPSNHEGQAARHYWKHLFENGFRREKQGARDGINARLNFGYAVLRSLIARQLASMGLNPSLGLGHCSSENPFNLADDFIEPYRYLVEYHVAGMRPDNLEQSLDGKEKQSLLQFITHTIPMQNGEFRLNGAVEATIGSYCRILEGRASRLHLPVF